MPGTPLPRVGAGYAVSIDCNATMHTCCAGFVPNSMLEFVESGIRPEVGAPIAVMFVEVDSTKKRMILSQKRVPNASLITELDVGSTVQVRSARVV
jgi:ribosomal protein S1